MSLPDRSNRPTPDWLSDGLRLVLRRRATRPLRGYHSPAFVPRGSAVLWQGPGTDRYTPAMTDNQPLDNDTIAAIATPPGRGGVGIIRLSGGEAALLGKTICARPLSARFAHYVSFQDADGTVLDTGLALLFPGPASFTGETVVEFHAHGGPVILDLLLRRCLALGARMARPGEFSERAFLNGKMDLVQAEAIADLINSSTEQAAMNASRSLQGAFSREVDALMDAVTRLRVFVEAAIDFPEEEIDFLTDGRVRDQLVALIGQAEGVLQVAKQGRLIQEGMKLVIAGRPNAGKSSLLNALSGRDSAIVTAIAGTTRDVLREHIQIDGMPLHIVDTAGLRHATDAIEQEGIRRAWEEIESADRLLLVVDGGTDSQAVLSQERPVSIGGRAVPDQIPVTVVINKCDLSSLPATVSETGVTPMIRLSARTGEGLDLLCTHLKQCMGFNPGGDGNFSARRRHLEALEGAHALMQHGLDELDATGAGELLAEDLRESQNRLGEITGAVSSDQLLGKIFSNFCIGK